MVCYQVHSKEDMTSTMHRADQASKLPPCRNPARLSPLCGKKRCFWLRGADMRVECRHGRMAAAKAEGKYKGRAPTAMAKADEVRMLLKATWPSRSRSPVPPSTGSLRTPQASEVDPWRAFRLGLASLTRPVKPTLCEAPSAVGG
jgi:hypothetical protein